MMLAGGRGDAPYAGRLGLLVDSRTASTAEAVASALREAGRGIVIGQQTAGAMLASSFIEVARGWRLQIPVFDFRSASGARVEGTGIRPDVPIDARADDDETIAHAIDAVAGRSSS
jgi:carboxyl-terminal processing protease